MAADCIKTPGEPRAFYSEGTQPRLNTKHTSEEITFITFIISASVEKTVG